VASAVVEEARNRQPVEVEEGMGIGSRAMVKGRVTDEEGSRSVQVADAVDRGMGIMVEHTLDVHPGNVMGEVRGKVVGEVTGNVVGEVTGNVMGEVNVEFVGKVKVEVTGSQKWVPDADAKDLVKN
jgi:hypothetical protein